MIHQGLDNMSAIKVENLTKEFDRFKAVDSLTFEVENGELFGLLGPNGAGKTTTINMLSTLLKPTSGYAEVAGYNITTHKDDVRKSIGIVFQEPALDSKLTGKENLQFHAMMYGIGKVEREKRINAVLELVELSDKAAVLVEHYSGGMKRRLEIARGLIHRPTVLFLDEPTLGLDTQTRRRIWEYIKKLNSETQVTIILTTHYMEEADYLCNRVAIIDYGKIVVSNTPSELKDAIGEDIIYLEIENNINDLMDTLKNFPWIKSMKSHNGTVSLGVKSGEKKIPELIGIAQKMGISVNSVILHKPSLEDVFLHYTGRGIREEENGLKNRHREYTIRSARR